MPGASVEKIILSLAARERMIFKTILSLAARERMVFPVILIEYIYSGKYGSS